MNKFIRGMLLSGVSLLCLQCTHKETRAPASSKPLVTDYEEQALLDIFGSDSPVTPYRRTMKIDFHTSGDKKYLSVTAKKALQQALVDTLGGEADEQSLGKVLAGNLKSAILENFVKTLKVFKIVNIGLQVDLNFVPEVNPKGDFSGELNSNQLVRLSEMGKLTRKWENIEKSTTTDSMYKNSAYVPARIGQADYIGGNVSIYVEILDTKPGIPKPFKNGVKGFIRYRRYFRLNQELAKNLACDDFTLNVKSAGPGVPLFYTVDLYKNFNLKSLIPTEETMEVFPGLLATNNEGRYELMPDTYEKSGKSIPTATFAVDYKRNMSGEVTFGLKKLVYDLKSKSLDIDKSKSELVHYYPKKDRDSGNEDAVVANAQRFFLKKCSTSLERTLKLDQVMPGDLL